MYCSSGKGRHCNESLKKAPTMPNISASILTIHTCETGFNSEFSLQKGAAKDEICVTKLVACDMIVTLTVIRNILLIYSLIPSASVIQTKRRSLYVLCMPLHVI
jgi:hypothetical protein